MKYESFVKAEVERGRGEISGASDSSDRKIGGGTRGAELLALRVKTRLGDERELVGLRRGADLQREPGLGSHGGGRTCTEVDGRWGRWLRRWCVRSVIIATAPKALSQNAGTDFGTWSPLSARYEGRSKLKRASRIGVGRPEPTPTECSCLGHVSLG